MTFGGLLTRVVMIQTYDAIYQEYRMVDLPWDSVVTWILTAVLLDLGYYWFHRASHEIGLLWAVHQVYDTIISDLFSNYHETVLHDHLKLFEGQTLDTCLRYSITKINSIGSSQQPILQSHNSIEVSPSHIDLAI